MKRGVAEGNTKVIDITFIVIIAFVFVISVSPTEGLLQKMRLTGMDTAPITVNITVGVPVVAAIYNDSMTPVVSGLQSGPSMTSVVINFSAYISTGAGNINTTSGTINFSVSGGDLRQNNSCQSIASAGNFMNFTCNVTMWWWDQSGNWSIDVSVKDNSSNIGKNDSASFFVGSTTGFQVGPGALTWGGLSAGNTNQTATNNLLLNNTGNDPIGDSTGNITINATNLRGETDNTLAIWVGNISSGTSTGSSAECNYISNSTATVLNAGKYQNITQGYLNADNYTINNGTAGQENLYFCISLVGSELTDQAYSTLNESSWTVQIA